MASNSYIFHLNDRQAIELEGDRPLHPEKDRLLILSRLTEAGASPESANAAYEKWRRDLPASEVVEPVVRKIPDVQELAGEMVQSAAIEGTAATVGQALGAASPVPGGVYAGGFIGGAVGNLANQGRRMLTGKQERWMPNLGETFGAALASAVPGGQFTKTGGRMARALKGAGRDAVINVGTGEIASRIDDQDGLSAEEGLLAAGLGVGGGALQGGMRVQPQPELRDIQESVRSSAMAKRRLSAESGMPYTSTRQEVLPQKAVVEDELQRNKPQGPLAQVADQNYRAQQVIQERIAGGAEAPTAAEIGERMRGYVGGQEVDPNRVREIQARMAEGIAGSPSTVGTRSQLAASQDLGTKMQTWVDQTKAESKRLYNEAHQALRAAYGGNQEPTFYPKRTAEAAKELLSELAPSDQVRFRESIGILDDLEMGDLSIDQLRNKRSLIGAMIKGEAGELGKGIQSGQLDQLYKSLTKDLDDIFDGLGPGIKEKFDAANKHFRENIEKSNLYNIEKSLASPEGRQNMAKTIVSEITSEGESQSLKNIEKVLGGPDPELDGYLRDAVLNKHFDRVSERLDLGGIYKDAYNIAKKSPELAQRLGLGQGDSLAKGRIALETFKGGSSVDMDILQDTMKRLNLSPQELMDDTTAIKRMLEAQKTRDAARTSALVNVLNNTGTDLRKLTDPKGIYNSVFNGENTTVDQIREIVDAFEARASSGAPDAGVAKQILRDVRRRKVTDFFDSVGRTGTETRAVGAVSAGEGFGFPEVDPVKLQDVLKDNDENRKLAAIIGQEKWWMLQDLAKAESANARAARTMQKGTQGGVSEVVRARLGPGLSIWGRAQATMIPFMANVFADPDVILTPGGRLRQISRSGDWISLVVRRAAAPGTPENEALMDALSQTGQIDKEGRLTPEGQETVKALGISQTNQQNNRN